MKAVTLALLVALPCFAQSADAPVIVTDGGVLLTPNAAVAAAQRIQRCEAERDTYKAAVPSFPVWVLPVVVGVLAAGAGFAVGYGVATAPK